MIGTISAYCPENDIGECSIVPEVDYALDWSEEERTPFSYVKTWLCYALQTADLYSGKINPGRSALVKVKQTCFFVSILVRLS